MIQTWIVERLNEELTVEILAEKALMSPRNFARVFLRKPASHRQNILKWFCIGIK
jgi:transcriptional regulator GlxA family with amidase domain